MKKIKDEPTNLHQLLKYRDRILVYSPPNEEWDQQQRATYVFLLLTRSLPNPTIKMTTNVDGKCVAMDESIQAIKSIYNYFDGSLTLSELDKTEEGRKIIKNVLVGSGEQRDYYNALEIPYAKLPNSYKLSTELTPITLEWYA